MAVSCISATSRGPNFLTSFSLSRRIIVELEQVFQRGHAFLSILPCFPETGGESTGKVPVGSSTSLRDLQSRDGPFETEGVNHSPSPVFIYPIKSQFLIPFAPVLQDFHETKVVVAMAPFLSEEEASTGEVSESIDNLKLANQPLITGKSQKKNFLPVSNPTETFWQQDPHELHDYRSTEHPPQHTEILIIGAGYAGVSTAYHLIKETQKSITLLEARGACSGASGRNGGHLRPDLYGHIPTYCDRAGADAGAEIAKFEIAHVQAIKKVVEEEKIDCEFTLCRSYDVWCNEEAGAKAKEMIETMQGNGFEYMDDVVFYDGKNAEGVSSFFCV
jgi:hypothetical protein